MPSVASTSLVNPLALRVAFPWELLVAAARLDCGPARRGEWPAAVDRDATVAERPLSAKDLLGTLHHNEDGQPARRLRLGTGTTKT